MYIPRSFIVALLSAPFLAYAQSTANPFNNPAGGYQVTAGKPLTLSWKPTTGGTVSLTLRMGNSGDLSTVTTIANNIPNDGSYTWDVPEDTVRGSSYTIEIASDSNPSETNYTPQFVLESTNNAAPTSSASTMTTAASTVTPSSTSGATSSMTMSTDSASSSSMASTTSSMATMTTATSSGSSSSSESTASTSGNSDLVATQSASSTSSGGAARATAMAGMLGVVALGALAL